MTATLRIEIFPQDIKDSIDFYTRILQFTLIRYEAKDVQHEPASPSALGDEAAKQGYAYFVRNSIHIGADTRAPVASIPTARNYRRPPTGVELVIEVPDLLAERERIRDEGWPVREDEDVKMQDWGLRDFRLEDPDGYFIRLTEMGLKGDGTGF